MNVTRSDPQHPKELLFNPESTACICVIQCYIKFPDLFSYTTRSRVTLSFSYDKLWDRYPVNNDLDGVIGGPVPINNVSYISRGGADSVIMGSSTGAVDVGGSIMSAFGGGDGGDTSNETAPAPFEGCGTWGGLWRGRPPSGWVMV